MDKELLMKILLLGLSILLTGCAFSYTSSFSFELGNYKITNAVEEQEQEVIKQTRDEKVLSETRVGE
jgi:major membrane immunogen (membrane-anchored lipoprotein)